MRPEIDRLSHLIQALDQDEQLSSLQQQYEQHISMLTSQISELTTANQTLTEKFNSAQLQANTKCSKCSCQLTQTGSNNTNSSNCQKRSFDAIEDITQTDDLNDQAKISLAKSQNAPFEGEEPLPHFREMKGNKTLVGQGQLQRLSNPMATLRIYQALIINSSHY